MLMEQEQAATEVQLYLAQTLLQPLVAAVALYLSVEMAKPAVERHTKLMGKAAMVRYMAVEAGGQTFLALLAGRAALTEVAVVAKPLELVVHTGVMVVPMEQAGRTVRYFTTQSHGYIRLLSKRQKARVEYHIQVRPAVAAEAMAVLAGIHTGLVIAEALVAVATVETVGRGEVTAAVAAEAMAVTVEMLKHLGEEQAVADSSQKVHQTKLLVEAAELAVLGGQASTEVARLLPVAS